MTTRCTTGSRNVPSAVRPRLFSLAALAVLAVLALAAVPQAAQAQPFGVYLGFTGDPTSGYVRVPHSSALNPTGGFTFEAWVRITNSTSGEDCRSIAGKGYLSAWWIGQCNVSGQPTLRSYLKGGGSLRNGGVIPRGVWTHVAVTFDGANRRHYINGELVGTFAETGPLGTSTNELRIGSDVNWVHTPEGRIDEVRLWNVARSTAEIRSTINLPINVAQTGLVAVWNFQTTFNDIISTHDGTSQGSGVNFFTFAVSASCGANTSTTLCLQSRFLVSSKFRTGAPGTAEGTGQVAVANSGSGLFWFFSSDNWEVLVKALNGCGLNSRYWIFSAATTNVFYRLEAFDVVHGEQKIYFNYPGPPAPAVTDTGAFATCP